MVDIATAAGGAGVTAICYVLARAIYTLIQKWKPGKNEVTSDKVTVLEVKVDSINESQVRLEQAQHGLDIRIAELLGNMARLIDRIDDLVKRLESK
jgi:hypothetical protein